MRLGWIVKSNKLPPFLGRNSKKIHKRLILEMWIKIDIDQLQTITWNSFDSFLTRIGWIVKSNKLPPFLGRDSKKVHKGSILEMWSKIEIDQFQRITQNSSHF